MFPAEAEKAIREATPCSRETAFRIQNIFGDSVYRDYFPDGNQQDIKNVFRPIVDPNLAPDQIPGTDMIGNMEITQATEGDPRCNKEPKVVAYLDQLGRNAVINLCDDFFLCSGILPGANDVIVPGYLGPAVSSKMNSLGHFILNEMTHFKRITNAIGYPNIVDNGLYGYGCFNVRTGAPPPAQMASPHNRPPAQQVVDAYMLPAAQQLVNADNFAWFANENYWTVEVGPFDAPPTAQTCKDMRCKNAVCQIQ